MFNPFRKKKKIQSEDYKFLEAVVTKLPSKYEYLIEQVSEDFILDKEINDLGDFGTFTLTLNANLEAKFSNKAFPQFFIIKDIDVWNKKKGVFEQTELHILEGMLAGFRLISDYKYLDFSNIRTINCKEKHFKNEDKLKLKDILGKVDEKLLDQIDIENTFKIEVPEGSFYVIKDLGDGNYLSVDEGGAIYGMIHDPYEVDKIYEDKDTFLAALKKGEFNISEYLNKKLN
jgi:hypothetical protein